MPQAIAAVASAAADWVAAAVVSGAQAVGFSVGTSITIATYAAQATFVAITTLAAIGPGLLFKPQMPTPDFARSVKRQAIPDRVSGYGRVRLGGAYMLYEAIGEKAYLVYAMHDGLIDEWEELYLNDQIATIGLDGYVEAGADLRYGINGDNVKIDARFGLPTETNYADLTAEVPDLWPADARGDNVASLMMIARAPSKEFFLRDYPNGLPQPSRVGRLQLCWDPRLGPRGTINDDMDKAANPAWGWTQNPFRHLLDYMTNPETGMGLPIERFLPQIATWEEAMDVCDEAVPLAAGGTVPRYQAGGVYTHSTAPADVIATILATCDGWMAEDENGVFVVQAGKYYEPTVTITDAHIINLSREFFRPDEQSVNEMVVSYVDPTKAYTEVETDATRDEADILATGVVRPQRLSLPWVQNNSQARRLGKIAIRKAGAPLRGTLTTTLEGLKAWGQRRIRIQAPDDGTTMADVVVDILPPTLHPDLSVTIPWVISDPDAYEWNAATEEGAGPGNDVRPPPEPPVVPIIADVVSFDDDGATQRLRIALSNGTTGSTYVAQWRSVGSATWTQEAQQVAVAGMPYPYIDTGTIPSGAIEVQVAGISSGGLQSQWSATAQMSVTIITETGDAMTAEDGSLLIMES